jgi:hypothetical protein
MAKPAARQRALQKLNALLAGELFERHNTIKKEKGKRKKEKLPCKITGPEPYEDMNATIVAV